MSGLDLYLSQRVLAMMLVYAALVGFCLGGVRDVMGLLRAFLGHMNPEKGSERRCSIGIAILLFLEDTVFMFLAAVGLILLCYYTNDGQLRAPAFLGLAGGFFVYWHTLGRWSRKTIPLLAAWMWKILGVGIRLLLRPAHALVMVLLSLFRTLWRSTAGKMIVRHRMIATDRRLAALNESARQGFGIMEKAASELPPENE